MDVNSLRDIPLGRVLLLCLEYPDGDRYWDRMALDTLRALRGMHPLFIAEETPAGDIRE